MSNPAPDVRPDSLTRLPRAPSPPRGLVILLFLKKERPAQVAGMSRLAAAKGSDGDGPEELVVVIVAGIVILLGLLGSFDLLLTLAAQQAGGFMELNPLGSELITSPLGLAAFKLTSLVVACSILLRLRHYRGAQIASWWLCMICTVLTFRWVTFNSLFMT